MSATTAPYGPIKAPNGDPVQLSMQRLWLTGQVLPAGARLSIEHVLRSADKSPVEVIYSFPLPRDAALRRFRICGDSFEVHSELKPTQAAVAAYEQAITSGSLAGLARQYADGVVNLTLGNLRPDEIVTVRLEMVAGMELRDDGFRFRFPFTLAPGYHARARMANGEIELPLDEFGDVILPPIRKDASGLHEVGFDLSLTSQLEFEEIASPSHAVRVRHENSRSSRVSLAQESDVPDRDLVIEGCYRERRPQILAGKKQFVAVLPSATFGTLRKEPRRVVFLLDRSASMDGLPLEQALKSIRACLGALAEEDMFGVVAFDDRAECFQPRLVSGSRENRDQAHDFLQKIGARGGTELALGFAEAVRILGKAGGDVLIMTDGQVMGTEEILERARAEKTRLHCLGIGSASQDRFLALLARETGGVSRFVGPRERVDLSAVDLFASMGRPIASGLQVAGNVQPQPPAAVFAGTPVILFGEGTEEIKLTWDGGGETSFAVEYGNDTPLDDTIRLLQGSRLITDWDSRYPNAEAFGAVQRRQQSRAAVRLRQLSEEYGLASREMSLVAVVTRPADRPGELPQTRVVPVGMPQDTRFSSYFGPSDFTRTFALHGLVGDHRAEVYDLSDLLCSGAGDAPESFPPPPQPPPTWERPSGARGPARLVRGMFDRRADDPAAEPAGLAQSDEDRLVDLAGRLEPDGGMPGRGADERAGASMVALLAFLSHGHTLHEGAFRSHVARLVGFLESLSGLAPERQQLITRVLALAEKRRILSRDWLGLATSPGDWGKLIEAALAATQER